MPRSAFVALTALLTIVATSPAIAARPTIVGTYTAQISVICPPVLDLAAGKLSYEGDLETEVVTMKFTSTGTVTVQGSMRPAARFS